MDTHEQHDIFMNPRRVAALRARFGAMGTNRWGHITFVNILAAVDALIAERDAERAHADELAKTLAAIRSAFETTPLTSAAEIDAWALLRMTLTRHELARQEAPDDDRRRV